MSVLGVNKHNKGEDNGFEWDVLLGCNSEGLLECANLINRLIFNINDTAGFIRNVVTENQSCVIKITELEDQVKRLEKCNNCAVLTKKLDDQNAKIQQLAQMFGQITNTFGTSEKTQQNNIEKVHDIFTEMIEDNPDLTANNDKKDSRYGKRKVKYLSKDIVSDTKKCEDIINFETPKKRLRLNKQTPSKADVENEAEEPVLSPILGKAKRNINASFGDNSKSPLANLSNRLAEKIETLTVTSPITKKSNLGDLNMKELSPSLLGKISDTDKTPSPEKLMNIKQDYEDDVDENRRSLSLLHVEKPVKLEDTKRNKKCPKSKKMKQARLSFSKAKARAPLDVSTSDNFCGGVRGFSSDNVITKEDEDEMLKIALQLSLKENIKHSPDIEEDDIIDASPADKQKTVRHKVQVHRTETPLVKKGLKCGKGDSVSIVDNDETMFDPKEFVGKEQSPVKRKKHEKKSSVSSSSIFDNLAGSKTSPKKNTRSHASTSIHEEPEYAYVEDVVRKKSDRKNLQGWGCKKCKDFYEVAFEGNNEVIKNKMNECSRHRGKFDPIRMETPPGFWDLKMPPTQDTEAFNKRNNRT